MRSLKVASALECADRDYVLARVKINGLELQFASEPLRNDPEIAFAAVNQCGMALGYTSDSLREDSRIVDRAMEKNYEAVVFAGTRLRYAPEFIVRGLGQAVIQSKRRATSTTNAMKKILTHSLVTPQTWAAIGERLDAHMEHFPEHRATTLAAVGKDYQAIYTAPEALRAEPAFMLRAFGHALTQSKATSGITPILEKVIGYSRVSHEAWAAAADQLAGPASTKPPQPPPPADTFWIDDLGSQGKGWVRRT